MHNMIVIDAGAKAQHACRRSRPGTQSWPNQAPTHTITGRMLYASRPSKATRKNA